ncbi:uncharacterized protein [Henckelia pumila]|uniref:uncharacterized protein n=1 Tax=Henckelia pumila TaxID=405737 RepID=UPI003C6E9C84
MTDANTPILNEVSEPPSKSQRVEFDETSLERDPGLRILMWRHPVNHRDEIRRCYIKMGPYHPKLSEYPRSESVKHNILPSQLKDLEVRNVLMMELSVPFCLTWEIQKNRLRLTTTIECIRRLSLQACGLRGHDESLDSQNRGNFIEMLKFMGKWNASIGEVILEKAPGNAKYISPKVHKEILHIIGNRIRNKIRDEIEDSKFCILVDEAKDVSNKEQMAIILRFVDTHVFLRERFFQIVHVHDTAAATLKKEICDLALVACAEKEISIWLLFSNLTTIVNLVTSSSKRNVELQSAQVNEISRSIAVGERETGRGANQMGLCIELELLVGALILILFAA